MFARKKISIGAETNKKDLPKSAIYNSRLVRKTPLKKTAIKKKPPKPGEKKKRCRIKPVSDKQAILNALFNELSKDFLRKNPLCMAKIPHICTYYATECHHKRGRGKYTLVREYLLPVCRNAHQKIGDKSALAFECGDSLLRND